MSLAPELLVLTHLAAASVGAACTYAAVVTWGQHLTDHRKQEEHHVPNRKLRRGTWLGIVLLIASGMVLAIGVMAYLQAENNADQRAADKRAEAARAAELRQYSLCISEWGADLVATINERNAQRAAYDTAQQLRDDATARVVRIVLLLRREPPRATELELDEALAAAARADDRVTRAKAKLDSLATTYEPPTLTCGRTP